MVTDLSDEYGTQVKTRGADFEIVLKFVSTYMFPDSCMESRLCDWTQYNFYNKIQNMRNLDSEVWTNYQKKNR